MPVKRKTPLGELLMVRYWAMFKIGIIGIDNTGKTSIVESLGKEHGIEQAHLTTHHQNHSKATHALGRFLGRFARFGEKRHKKTLTGFAYFLHLIPYYMELKAKKTATTLISDRDPVLDTLTYAHYYLADWFYKWIKRPLRYILEKFFSYPNLLFYLDVSPEVSIKRYSKIIQLHERAETLNRLRDIYNEELSRIKKLGVKVIFINTDEKDLNQVIKEVKSYLPLNTKETVQIFQEQEKQAL